MPGSLVNNSQVDVQFGNWEMSSSIGGGSAGDGFSYGSGAPGQYAGGSMLKYVGN